MKLLITETCEPHWTHVEETATGEISEGRKVKLSAGQIRDDLPPNIEQRLLNLRYAEIVEDDAAGAASSAGESGGE